MRAKFKKPIISDFDFLKVYCAVSLANGKTLLKKEELEKDLFKYTEDVRFIELFSDIEKISSTDLSRVNLDDAFLNAYAYGYILKIHDVGPCKSKIIMSPIHAKEVLKQYPLDQVDKFFDLFTSLDEEKTYGYQLAKKKATKK